jgi:hypothetical protein
MDGWEAHFGESAFNEYNNYGSLGFALTISKLTRNAQNVEHTFPAQGSPTKTIFLRISAMS